MLRSWRRLSRSPAADAAEQALHKPCYAWEGEDILVAKIFSDVLGIQTGFFVDVGAHHPVALSNTYLLYTRGWRGINIDAMPGSMDSFRELRPGDTNLEMGIALQPCRLKFAMFADPALNGFLSPEQIHAQNARGQVLLGERELDAMPLTAVLDREKVRHPIDLLNVDVEGIDLEVYQSLDFSRYRPKVIVAEILGCSDVRSVLASPICRYLESQSYTLFSRLHFSSVFIDRKLVA